MHFLASSAAGVLIVVYLLLVVLEIAAFWMVFQKAGQPGWAAIIPLYNVWVYCKVAGRPGWWMFLFLIPFANIVISLIVALDIAKRFGKGGGFGVGLWLLGFIFFPILGFGSATYNGGVPPAVAVA